MDHPDFNLCARFTPMQAVCSLIDKNQEKKTTLLIHFVCSNYNQTELKCSHWFPCRTIKAKMTYISCHRLIDINYPSKAAWESCERSRDKTKASKQLLISCFFFLPLTWHHSFLSSLSISHLVTPLHEFNTSQAHALCPSIFLFLFSAIPEVWTIKLFLNTSLMFSFHITQV